MDKRGKDRMKAVLPVKVRGRDISGQVFEELAHTLDVTTAGARLGGIRHQLKERDLLTVLYRQRKIDFRVVWTKKLEGSAEYQVGLQAVTQEREAWGLNVADFKIGEASLPVAMGQAVATT